jgi:hypothetical protein
MKYLVIYEKTATDSRANDDRGLYHRGVAWARTRCRRMRPSAGIWTLLPRKWVELEQA